MFSSKGIIQKDILVWMPYTSIEELLAQIFTGHISLDSSGGLPEIFVHVTIPFQIPTYWQFITIFHFMWRYKVLMFCWPCVIVYQYSETNELRFFCSLLRIRGLYMFRALPTHPQEALHKRHLVYCVRVVSWLHQVWSSTSILVQPTGITRTQYTKCRLWNASWGWAGGARNM
jgi:hypothetical protein